MQGPIDDAFMSSFLFVTPGKTTNDPFGIWEKSERNRAMTHWRQQFRGDVRVKADSDIDLSEKPGPNRPGKIVDAGFFDENWKLK